eukprot:1286393-Pyramimonas_sp.AAC.1
MVTTLRMAPRSFSRGAVPLRAQTIARGQPQRPRPTLSARRVLAAPWASVRAVAVARSRFGPCAGAGVRSLSFRRKPCQCAGTGADVTARLWHLRGAPFWCVLFAWIWHTSASRKFSGTRSVLGACARARRPPPTGPKAQAPGGAAVCQLAKPSAAAARESALARTCAARFHCWATPKPRAQTQDEPLGAGRRRRAASAAHDSLGAQKNARDRAARAAIALTR